MYTRNDIKACNRIVTKELNARRWGAEAPGTSPSGAKRYYIFDYRALGLVAGIYRYKLKDKDVSLFYRGQTKDYPIKASLFRTTCGKRERDAAVAWEQSILQEIAPYFDHSGTDEEREALAQHYGLHTQFIDVADNIQTAIWFAYDRNVTEKHEFDDDVGYVAILGLPNDDGGKLIDLRKKPSQWLRPHVQQAFVYKAADPQKQEGAIDRFHIATLVIPRSLMKIWSNYEYIGHDAFYPPESHDEGLRFWNKAKAEAEKKGFDFKKY